MQTALGALLPVGRPARMRVVRDYGPVGDGVSQARFVKAENGNEYLIKGQALSSGHPLVAANEYLAATFGHALGLPLLEYAVVEHQGDVFFASARMPAGSFDPGIGVQTFSQCINSDRAYDLVVFDSWLCNQDRHQQNLIVRRGMATAGQPELSLVFNDHGHCLMPPGRTPGSLGGWLGQPATMFIALDFVRDAIVEHWRLAAAVAAIEALTDDVIGAHVQTTPTEFLPAVDRPRIAGFLCSRRDELRQVFNVVAGSFPALQGALL